MTAGARATTKTEIHHLLEKRMVENMQEGTFKIAKQEVDSKIPSLVLDSSIHQQITNELRQRIPYGIENYNNLSKEVILKNYHEVYKNFGMDEYVRNYIEPLFK